MTNRTKQRWRNHAWLAAGGLGCGLVVFLLDSSTRFNHRISLSTGYLALGFVAFTLVIGPWNAVRGRRTPVSTDLRRDAGWWAAGWSALHTWFGLHAHFLGHMARFFLYPIEGGFWHRLRGDVFGWANHTVAVAMVVALILVVLSNDRSLRWLGAQRWKTLQRLNYLSLAALVAHSILYQILEKRTVAAVVAFALVVAGVVGMQIARVVRRWSANPGPALSVG